MKGVWAHKVGRCLGEKQIGMKAFFDMLIEKSSIYSHGETNQNTLFQMVG